MSATDELHRLLDERGVKHRDVGSMTFWCDALSNKWCATEQEDDSLHVQCMNFLTPEQVIAATVGRDERESYDAGFASGVKATLQQLYGLLHEYPTLDEIEAWADSQWEDA